ncbi:hypothetical protein C3F00_037250 [Pseudomonas sp. MWU13-2860]|nr:hypothetical protein C3F00_037250 [Pseudomonas sp. MWU13-2860]
MLRSGESSERVRERVECAYRRQLARQGKANAELSGVELESYGDFQADALALLREALDKIGLSARAYHRILRVSRTIADLQGQAMVMREHVLQAIQLRRAAMPNG